jgi:hypothetical protein
VIAVASSSPLSQEMRDRNAESLQERYDFRFPLPQILQRRRDSPASSIGGDVITDDFAPADVYDVMGRESHRREQ